MNSRVNYTVNSKENLYFFIRLIFSAIIYGFIFMSISKIFSSENPATKSLIIIYAYILIILFAVFVRLAFQIGYLRGNAIKITPHQFPDIYQLLSNHSRVLGLNSIPTAYILQSGGILNAFASRFMGNNYIILNSDIIEAAEKDKHMLSFIIGHELGHIKRNHMLKNLLLLPSWIIPFLGSAYSRACEYTCDSIGYSLAPFGADNALLLLAAGKTIYKRVNVNEYISQQYTETGFWTWFAEKVSSHPNLTKRLSCFVGVTTSTPAPEFIPEPVVLQEKKETDYSKYMPK